MAGKGLVLVTGGAGYVGSHTIIELLNSNYSVVAIDNLVNCYAEKNQKPESLKRVEKITGKQIVFYNVDIRDKLALEKVFKTVCYSFTHLMLMDLMLIFFFQHKIDFVIHFAALKAVGESVQIPLMYYQNNIAGSSTLFQVMSDFSVKKLVFSSSATVYGTPQYLPITEEHITGQGCTNPYGKTK